uniref:Uncharacterized protein n=1 Tax=Mycena chlorophos TaxID=658473 RepID=A0ABQ0LKU4_MYCCL|nr:predicted protein [Mycena chlorophos]
MSPPPPQTRARSPPQFVNAYATGGCGAPQSADPAHRSPWTLPGEAEPVWDRRAAEYERDRERGRNREREHDRDHDHDRRARHHSSADYGHPPAPFYPKSRSPATHHRDRKESQGARSPAETSPRSAHPPPVRYWENKPLGPGLPPMQHGPPEPTGSSSRRYDPRCDTRDHHREDRHERERSHLRGGYLRSHAALAAVTASGLCYSSTTVASEAFFFTLPEWSNSVFARTLPSEVRGHKRMDCVYYIKVIM